MPAKLRFPQWLLYPFAIIILGMIFFAYFAPDMMVAITNSVWAMCGW
ncbi:hypothetical protein ICN30_00305 [Polynucleobacter sp. 31A-FELB]|jgi:hypothetical protein|nr:hypothetical protein [Polynucleobacter sp. 31A-FELB]MBU3586277.1 hypothetical protein [Polynucleobacter sp. 31A-FELB]